MGRSKRFCCEMMNSPMLNIMQLVLWLVILSTFCYTWLASTEPSLSLKKDLREENSPVNLTALAPIVTKKLDSKGRLDAPVRRKVKKEGYSGLGDASVEPMRIKEVVGKGTSNNLAVLPEAETRGASSNLEQGCISQPSTGLEKQIKDYILQKACPISFFLFWTTTSAPNATANNTGFQTRHLRSVESAFVTHPTACVIFLSTLPFENRYMSALQDRGYNLLILDQFDVTSLLKYTPTEVWYYRVDEWRQGQYFFSHFTDLMRLAILYKFGGVYIDTDCIVMQDLTSVRNVFGAQMTDGETGVHKEVDGGVMIFDRGNSFLYECMVEASGNYNQWDWEWNGPGLLRRMIARPDLEGSYTVLPTMAIYPIYFRDIWAYFDVNGDSKSRGEQEAFWARMRNETYVFHWYNQFALQHEAREGSLMWTAFNEFCIFCDEVVV